MQEELRERVEEDRGEGKKSGRTVLVSCLQALELGPVLDVPAPRQFPICLLLVVRH